MTETAVVDGKVVMNKASADEIKEKMEQQLRIQRAAHQQKRALEMKTPQGQMIKMVGTTAQGKREIFVIVKSKYRKFGLLG